MRSHSRPELRWQIRPPGQRIDAILLLGREQLPQIIPFATASKVEDAKWLFRETLSAICAAKRGWLGLPLAECFVAQGYRLRISTTSAHRLPTLAALPADAAPEVLTWEEQNAVFLDAVEHERAMMTIVLFVVMLIAAFLVIPAASARMMARTFAAMTVLAVLIGVASTLVGLFVSYELDIPSGATIILIDSEPLISNPLVVLAPASHPLAKRSRIRFAEIADQAERTKAADAPPCTRVSCQCFAAPQGAVIAVADTVPGEYEPALDAGVFSRQRRGMRRVVL